MYLSHTLCLRPQDIFSSTSGCLHLSLIHLKPGYFVVCLNVSESQVLLSKMHCRYQAVTSVVSLKSMKKVLYAQRVMDVDKKTII